MGKYQDTDSDIFSLFDVDTWTIKTVPSNFVTKGLEKYIRVNIIKGSKGIYFNSLSGILMIEIFISAGEGPKELSLIADKLDSLLQGKTLSTKVGAITQLGISAMADNGIDKDNAALFKATYTIPFKYFGVN